MPPVFLLLLLWLLQSTTLLLGTVQVPGTMRDATPLGNGTLLPSTCDPSYLFTKRTGETAVNISFYFTFFKIYFY